MANDIPDLNPEAPDDPGRATRSVARWMNTSRYVAVVSLFAEQQDGRAETDQAPGAPVKRRLTRQDREALVYAGVILLVIAFVAFVAGLL